MPDEKPKSATATETKPVETKKESTTPTPAPGNGATLVSLAPPSKSQLPVLIWHKGNGYWISYNFVPTPAVAKWWMPMPPKPE
jgi:hypothetical protein